MVDNIARSASGDTMHPSSEPEVSRSTGQSGGLGDDEPDLHDPVEDGL